MKKDHPDSRSRPAPFRISIPSLVEAGSREQAQVGRQPVPPTVLLPRSTPATTATAPPYAPSTNGKGPGKVEDGRGGGRLGEGGGGASLPQASVPWGRGQEAVFDAKHQGSMTLPILPPSHNPSAGVNVISVSPRQEGNPVLKKIKNVRYQFIPGIVPDYVLGAYTCCIFISLRYHLLHGQYLFQRVKELRRDYRLRLILCLVDDPNNKEPLLHINTLAIRENCTLVLAWSTAEAARYLETFKAYENKSSESIQERIDDNYTSRLTNVLTTIRGITRTNVSTLSSHFGSLASMMAAAKAEIIQCPDMGEVRVQSLWSAFHEPFIRPPSSLAANQLLPPPPSLPDSAKRSKRMHGAASAGKARKRPAKRGKKEGEGRREDLEREPSDGETPVPSVSATASASMGSLGAAPAASGEEGISEIPSSQAPAAWEWEGSETESEDEGKGEGERGGQGLLTSMDNDPLDYASDTDANEMRLLEEEGGLD